MSSTIFLNQAQALEGLEELERRADKKKKRREQNRTEVHNERRDARNARKK